MSLLAPRTKAREVTMGKGRLGEEERKKKKCAQGERSKERGGASGGRASPALGLASSGLGEGYAR